MKVVCAWCLDDMPDVEGDAFGVSHGMCPNCVAKALGERGGSDARSAVSEAADNEQGAGNGIRSRVFYEV